MTPDELRKQLYKTLKNAANEINKIDRKAGFYALRKVNSVNETSDLQALLRVSEDIGIIYNSLH